ncbi:MAG: DUF6152 family protein [Rhodospirillaceae bacterium]|nr:DUF6152 family protein [Rhodospirillaceae bacterium]
MKARARIARHWSIAIAALTLSVLPAVTGAHHSRAEFSEDVFEIEGEIVEVAWRNPHPIITVRSVDAAGMEKLWKVESWQSANTLERKGVRDGNPFRVGDSITVAGRESTRRPGLVLGTNARLADGGEIVLRSQGESHFGGPVVGGVEWAIGNSVASASEEPEGIFRVWSIVSRDVVPGELPLTQAAVEQAASFDELRDHPQWNCQPEGMPLVMDSFYPIEFTDHGDTISLRLERTDATRTIHMRADASSENQAPSRMGYSVGHWEEDTLVATTDKIDFPYFDDDGTPQTESLVIVERFTMDDDRTTLQSTAIATDPATFTAPVTILTNWRWVPGEAIKPWNCAVSE